MNKIGMKLKSILTSCGLPFGRIFSALRLTAIRCYALSWFPAVNSKSPLKGEKLSVVNDKDIHNTISESQIIQARQSLLQGTTYQNLSNGHILPVFHRSSL